MEWLRLAGSFKSYVSFAKEPYKRDCILQKGPMILRSLLICAAFTLIKTDVILNAKKISEMSKRCDWVAMIRRLLQITGLLCKRARSLKRCSLALIENNVILNAEKFVNAERLRENPVTLQRFLRSPHIPLCHPSVGWLRSVGSIKLQVSFAKEPYERDEILQKRPIILIPLCHPST